MNGNAPGFDPTQTSALLARLQQQVRDLRKESVRWQRHTASLTGTGTERLVTVTVTARGVVADVAFSPSISTSTALRLSEAFTRAYTAATEAAGNTTRRELPAEMAGMVAETAADPAEEGVAGHVDLGGESSAATASPELPGGSRIVHAWRHVDTIGVDAVMERSPFPRLRDSSPSFDEAMAVRVKQAADEARSGADVSSVRGVGESGHVRVEVSFAGILRAVSFKRSALCLSPDELRTEFLSVHDDAQQQARHAVDACADDERHFGIPPLDN